MRLLFDTKGYEANLAKAKTSLKDFDSIEFDCSGVGFQAGIMFDF